MGLFSKTDVESAVKEYEEKNSRLPDIDPGEHILTLSDIEISYTKKTTEPMIIFEFTKDDKHKPLRMNSVLGGKGSDISQKILIQMLYAAFDYKIKEAEDAEDLLSQLKKFKGEKLKVAVRGVESLYSKTNDASGKTELKIITRSEVWYCGHKDDDKFYINESNILKELSKKDKGRLADYDRTEGKVKDSVSKIDVDLPGAEDDTTVDKPDTNTKTKEDPLIEEAEVVEETKTEEKSSDIEDIDDDLPF